MMAQPNQRGARRRRWGGAAAPPGMMAAQQRGPTGWEMCRLLSGNGIQRVETPQFEAGMTKSGHLKSV